MNTRPEKYSSMIDPYKTLPLSKGLFLEWSPACASPLRVGLPTNIKLRLTDNVKHSSLVRYGINRSCKKFMCNQDALSKLACLIILGRFPRLI